MDAEDKQAYILKEKHLISEIKKSGVGLTLWI
ncbi:MAG: hypothetical protein ACI9UJ_000673 [bacterium]|jgi:hypothetical protein